MQPETDLPVIAVINDLEALISEIDSNPRLSSWVIRLILKSIKDKARKMVTETPYKSVSLKEPLVLDSLPTSSPANLQKIKALQPQSIPVIASRNFTQAI